MSIAEPAHALQVAPQKKHRNGNVNRVLDKGMVTDTKQLEKIHGKAGDPLRIEPQIHGNGNGSRSMVDVPQSNAKVPLNGYLELLENEAGERDGVAEANPSQFTAAGRADRARGCGLFVIRSKRGCSALPSVNMELRKAETAQTKGFARGCT